jgi:hypothetical protein
MNFLKSIFFIGSLPIISACHSQTTSDKNEIRMNKDSLHEIQSAKSKGNSKEITCKLTAPELQKRRAEVLNSLKTKVLEKKELKDGYKYKFESTDLILDELISFIKTERLCCDFFNFSILISADDNYAWLFITGPKGAKEFIEMEMDL